jgi:hypothetical protein
VPFLAVDEQRALAGQHEEVLLHALGVVEAVRLAGLEDADVDPELRELGRLVLERAVRAERLRRSPCRVLNVDDEPALFGRYEA